MSPSSFGTNPFSSGEPSVVAMPAVADKSLMACGMPCSQPLDWPRASNASCASASASSASASRRLTMAL